MRCEDARPLLLKGAPGEAEAHLEGCDACFLWLEAHDPMVGVLEAARPRLSPVPARVAAAVLARWRPHRVSFRHGIAAAMALSLIGLTLAALFVAAAPALVASLIASMGDLGGTVAAVILGLLAVPRALLFDQPMVLAVFTAGTIAVCALWARLYHQSQVQRRVI